MILVSILKLSPEIVNKNHLCDPKFFYYGVWIKVEVWDRKELESFLDISITGLLGKSILKSI